MSSEPLPARDDNLLLTNRTRSYAVRIARSDVVLNGKDPDRTRCNTNTTISQSAASDLTLAHCQRALQESSARQRGVRRSCSGSGWRTSTDLERAEIGAEGAV